MGYINYVSQTPKWQCQVGIDIGVYVCVIQERGLKWVYKFRDCQHVVGVYSHDHQGSVDRKENQRQILKLLRD